MSEQLRQSLAAELATDLARAIEAMTSEQPKLTVGKDAPSLSAVEYHMAADLHGHQRCGVVIRGVRAPGHPSGLATLRAAGIEESDSETSKVDLHRDFGAGSLDARAIHLRTNQDRVDPWRMRRGCGRAAPGTATGHRFISPLGTANRSRYSLRSTKPCSWIWTQHRPPGIVVTKAPAGQLLREKSKTLELLLDVELPVSVSFGRAQLPLKGRDQADHWMHC